MPNPFAVSYTEDKTDEALVDAALLGNRAALEELIARHQPWIYNIAFRMVYRQQDAEDVTQEVLLKILLRLSTFRKESNFRTWMYRIVANHVLSLKKRQLRTMSFSEYAVALDTTPDLDLPDVESLPVDASLLVEETKFECMMGMLLCLDPLQRLIFILGGLMGVSDSVGGEIIGISKDNFRQKLSRARRDLRSFMEDKCGLVDPANPCRCEKKTKALIDRGVVNPHSLVYNARYYQRIHDVAGDKVKAAEDWFNSRSADLFDEQPFYDGAPKLDLKAMLSHPQFRQIFNFGEQIQ